MSAKFKSKDTDNLIYKQIKDQVDEYFIKTKQSRNANRKLYFKFFIQSCLLIASVMTIYSCSTFGILSLAYTLVGLTLLVLGINIGHDAAHHCITGNRKMDDFLFQFTYALQGSGDISTR